MNIKIFCDLFKEKHHLKEVKDLGDIIIFFEKLKTGIENNETSALIIGDYLYNNISADRVRKRKSSATEFEDFLDYAFGGKVTDAGSRKNIVPNASAGVHESISNYVAGNRREKMDIIFPSKYGVSLKTSMPDNPEINLGSFAREALFLGFLTSQEYGGERKSGLGSKPQLEATFKKIELKNKWSEFYERFKSMVKYIYVDDIIFVVKDNMKLQIYFIRREMLIDLLIEAVKGGPHSAINIINRYEGNSFRVERDKLIQKGIKIELDFSNIEKTNIKKLLNLFNELAENILILLEKKDVENYDKFLLQKMKEIRKNL